MLGEEPRDIVVTVRGPVDGARLGPTLMHEHLHMDSRGILANGHHTYESSGTFPLTLASAAEARWNPGLTPDNYDFTDVDLIVDELEPLVNAGGGCVVDVTSEGIARSPSALEEISRRTGLHIVMGGSYSTNAMDADDPIRRTSAEALAERFITESIHGVGNTGIRPGILGEIGTGPTVLEDEAKVLRASAWAHHETGLALSIHLHPWSKAGHEVLDILAREAVPSHRIVLGHLNPYVDDLSYIRSLLERGVYAEFDLFGFDHSLLTMGRYAPSDFDVAQAVVELMDQYSERILISHDIGVKTRLHRFGGWGYDHILVHVVPLLRNLGLKEAAVELLMVGNPRSVLILDPLPSYLGKFASSVEAK